MLRVGCLAQAVAGPSFFVPRLSLAVGGVDASMWENEEASAVGGVDASMWDNEEASVDVRRPPGEVGLRILIYKLQRGFRKQTGLLV